MSTLRALVIARAAPSRLGPLIQRGRTPVRHSSSGTPPTIDRTKPLAVKPKPSAPPSSSKSAPGVKIAPSGPQNAAPGGPVPIKSSPAGAVGSSGGGSGFGGKIVLVVVSVLGVYGGALLVALENRRWRPLFEDNFPFAPQVLAFLSPKDPSPIEERDMTHMVLTPAKPKPEPTEVVEDSAESDTVPDGAALTALTLKDGVWTPVDVVDDAKVESEKPEDTPASAPVDPAGAALDAQLNELLSSEDVKADSDDSQKPDAFDDNKITEVSSEPAEEATSDQPNQSKLPAAVEDVPVLSAPAAPAPALEVVVTASDEELVSKLLAARSAILESDGEAQVDPAEVADLTPEAVELMNSTRRLSVIETKLEALVNSEEDLLKTALTSQRQRLAKEYADALQRQQDSGLAQLQRECDSLRAKMLAQYEADLQKMKEANQLELQSHLNVQQQAHEKHLHEELSSQAKKIWSTTESEIMVRLGRERAQRIVNLEKMFVRLKAAEAVLKSHKEAEAAMRQSQAVFVAAEGLSQAVAQQQPLGQQLRALLEVGGNNEVVRGVLATLPAEAQRGQGVPTRRELSARFDRVARAVRRVALVGERQGVFPYAVAHALSFLRVRRRGLVSGDDVEAVLARAEYHLMADDIDMAAREVNQLTGAARAVAKDWLSEARLFLEVEQAITVIRAHVTLVGLGTL